MLYAVMQTNGTEAILLAIVLLKLGCPILAAIVGGMERSHRASRRTSRRRR